MLWLLGGVGALLFFSKNRIVEEVDTVQAESSDSWTKYDALFKSYGARYGVDWLRLKAIAMNESSLGTNSRVARGIEAPDDIEGSKSYDGKSWGLMQVTLSTARGMDPLATEAKLNDPEYSIGLAARYFQSLQRLFSTSDPNYDEWVVKSYNQGPGNSKKERDGKIDGYAQEYWERYLRNYERAKGG